MNIPNNFGGVHALANFQSPQSVTATPAQATFRGLMNRLESRPLKLSAKQLHAQSQGKLAQRSMSQQVFQDTAGVSR